MVLPGKRKEVLNFSVRTAVDWETLIRTSGNTKPGRPSGRSMSGQTQEILARETIAGGSSFSG
jgi:hypothetical protein